MRVLVVGSGGVGSAFVAIASKREAYTHITVADIDVDKANGAVATATNAAGGRVVAALIDASSEDSVAALAVQMQADVVLNACDPRFNPPIFEGGLRCRLSLRRHGDEPVGAACHQAVREDRHPTR